VKGKNMVLLTIFILLLSGIVFHINKPMTKDNAVKRTEGFIKAVNDNKPELIYNYLTPSIQKLISKEGFIENFAKERSYPYLTPLYLYLDNVELSEEGTEGTITCVVASRLPGEEMKFDIVFVDNNYYIDAFKDVADGSFIKKFEKLSS
jgi:hypothetical protein